LKLRIPVEFRGNKKYSRRPFGGAKGTEGDEEKLA
jgi:hypothetical protein